MKEWSVASPGLVSCLRKAPEYWESDHLLHRPACHISFFHCTFGPDSLTPQISNTLSRIPVVAPFSSLRQTPEIKLDSMGFQLRKTSPTISCWKKNICHNPVGQTVGVNYLKKLRPWMPKITQLNKHYSHDSRQGSLQPVADTGPLRWSDCMLVEKIIA